MRGHLMWRVARAAATPVALALTPRLALAHAGRPVEPHDLWSAWSLEPAVLLPLGASALLYSRGLRALWRGQSGRGVRTWQAYCFLAGWVTLALALLSPLDALGGVLFSGHMVQHELLMVVSAPLLVLGRPLIPLLWALPIGWRRALGGATRAAVTRRLWRSVAHPLSAWTLHAAAIWLWHLPAAYQATLRSEPMHALQHASFLGSGLLFWWALLYGRQGRMGYGAAIFYLFATAMHSGGLGALLTFASAPWYPAYTATEAWGLTPLEDQQLAGLIMWIPAGVSYLIAALALLAAWMRESERRAVRWQRRVLLRPT